MDNSISFKKEINGLSLIKKNGSFLYLVIRLHFPTFANLQLFLTSSEFLSMYIVIGKRR